MASPVLRALYLDRSRRLFSLTLAAMAINLVLASLFPLWLLAFSPALWGLPHLVASLRYSARPTDNSRGALFALAILSVLLIAIRVWADATASTHWLLVDRRLEFAGLLLAVFILAASRMQAAVSFGRLLPLFAGVLFFPRLTLGGLLYAHHFIAFFMWHREASTRKEEQKIAGLLLLFTLAHLIIFAGYLDSLFFVFPNFMELPFAGLSLGEVGQSIFGDFVSSPIIWCRLVVAFAFGQSVHYFIWLRAIPEQRLPYSTPTSFRQSAAWLAKDLGNHGARWAVVFTLAGSLMWFLLAFPVARVAYISIAAYHGFIEIASLALGRARASA
ncbi:MAG: hypothetical protein R3B54_09895 [Bdellovibrionota bacterium]